MCLGTCSGGLQAAAGAGGAATFTHFPAHPLASFAF